MVARFIRAFWIATVIAMVIAAGASIHWFGRSIGVAAALLAGIFSIAMIHPLLVLTNFIVSRLRGDPAPAAARLGPWKAIRMLDAEIDASVRGFWFAAPFLCGRPAPVPREGSAHRRHALLFVHGYFCNRAIWLSFMRDAAERGFVCEAITLADAFEPIENHAGAVDRAIDGVLEAARTRGRDARRVVIVAHSMGGLVARAALQTMDASRASRIARVMTLGTPHRGTYAARFAHVPNVRQMRLGSPWLRALDEVERRDGRGLPRRSYTTLFSHHDNIVYPQRTGALDDADVVAMSGVGHVALAYDRRVRRVVFERLDALEASEADDATSSVGQAAAATGT